MSSNMRLWVQIGIWVGLLVVPALLLSAERRSQRAPTDAAAPAVDMFAAIESKDIDVKLIPKDDKESRVIIKNNTRKPLTVKLPDAFAGVPVLAQRGGAPAAGGANRTQQTVGGGMGGGMMGGMGGGMGMMNIAPEKVQQFKVPTVCLEHGKPEPRPHTPYEIKPIEEYTSNTEVKELLTLFGKNGLSQRATQAAAWHLANNMSWEDLANKRIEHLDGSSEIWFSPQELSAGTQIAQLAVANSQEKANAKKKDSPTVPRDRSPSSEP
ncbi:MAG TPA: hypothetical protein VL175_10185 [Pirellulales bacterium]|nr:hypothetical protein [Pirellulales bacterium]